MTRGKGAGRGGGPRGGRGGRGGGTRSGQMNQYNFPNFSNTNGVINLPDEEDCLPMGETVIPKSYDCHLPPIIPTVLDFSTWSNEQIDLWYQIPDAHKVDHPSRVKYLNDLRTTPCNIGIAHDVALTVAGNVGKVILKTAKTEIAKYGDCFAQLQQQVITVETKTNDLKNSVGERLEVAFKAAKNDMKSSQEILLAHPTLQEKLIPLLDSDKETCRREVFGFLEPFGRKELLDWEDVEEVRAIGMGQRQRLCIQLMSNHQRQRIIQTWRKSGPELMSDLDISEQEQEHIFMEPGKTAHRQWVDRTIWKYHDMCNEKNLSSKGDKFFTVEKSKDSGVLRELKEHSAKVSKDPRIAKLKEEWEANKALKKAQKQASNSQNMPQGIVSSSQTGAEEN